MKNKMIDIETLSASPNAIIVSIGVVGFNREGLGEEFYRVCYHQQKNRDIQMSTVKWWMSQGEEARAVFKDENAVSLREALVDLKDFIDRDDNVWANGVTFDIGILENAFKEYKIKHPWKYTNIRCLRSIKAVLPVYNELLSAVREETSHNALDDAKCQAKALVTLANLKNLEL